MSNNDTTPIPALPIRYSRGKDTFDNRPEQKTSSNFDAFRETVLADRSIKKGKAYICAPMSCGPHDTPKKVQGYAHWRLKFRHQPCAFIAFDFDGFDSPDAFARTIGYLARFHGFAYTTASHRPEAPRARAILAINRELTRQERIAVSELIESRLRDEVGNDAIVFDQSVYRPEQPCYTPVTTSDVYHFDGDLIDADALLAGVDGSQSTQIPGSDLLGSNIHKESPPETPDEVKRARALLSRIPATKAAGCTREQYRQVIWALASTGWTCAESLARAWCKGAPAEFVEEDFVRDWKSFDPNKLNGTHYGTLHYLAAGNHQTASVDSDDWPEPQPIKPPFPDVKPFDTAWLPALFRAYVDDHAELKQVPPDMIAAPLMVAAAACIGNTYAIAPKARDTSWLVSPVLWGACISPPGTMKSNCINSGINPLKPIEAAMVSGFAARQQNYLAEKLFYDVQMDQAKAGAKKASSAASISLPLPPIEPMPERMIVNDSTVQKLGEILFHSPRGVLVIRDEIVSLLESLGAEGQEGARGFYLEAWNGLHAHRIDRIARGSLVIPRLALWLFGGIQPGRLTPYVMQATRGGSGDDGLLQRFQLLIWPDIPKQWIQVDRLPDLAASSAVDAVFAHLRKLNPVAVGACQGNLGDGPAFFHFTSEAQAVFDQWWANLEHSLRNGDKHPALESHQAKFKSLIPALALVIHLADYGTGPIPLHALEKAICWGSYLWSHAKRVYASATNAGQASAAELATRIMKGKVPDGFTVRSVYRHHWQHLSTHAEVIEGIECLIEAGWLRRQAPMTGQSGGRPSETFAINPKVLALTAPAVLPVRKLTSAEMTITSVMG